MAVVRSVPFLVLVALGLLNFTSNARFLGQLTGGPEPLPLTRLMVEIVSYAGLYVLILAAIYAAELVWRERAADIDEVTDALPAPTWVLWRSKLLALLATVGLVLLLAVAVGVGVQLASGYTSLEPGLYLRGVFLHRGASLFQFAVLALLVQVLVDRRYAGYGALIALLVVHAVLHTTLGLHPVLALAGTPSTGLAGVVYSDMNGYGPFAAPLIWFNVLWALECVVMLVLVHLFWVRGGETDWRSRLRAARLRWTPRVRTTAWAAGLAALATAGWIHYNTDLLNGYRTSGEFEALQASYERAYGSHAGLPQPRIERVRSEVDIHPHTGALEIRGSYRLRNATGRPIPALHVTTLPFLAATSVAVEDGTLTRSDEETGHRVFDL